MNRQKCTLCDRIICVSTGTYVGRRDYTGCFTIETRSCQRFLLAIVKFFEHRWRDTNLGVVSLTDLMRDMPNSSVSVLLTAELSKHCAPVLCQSVCVAFYLQTLSAWSGCCLVSRNRHTGIKCDSVATNRTTWYGKDVTLCLCESTASAEKPTKEKVKVVPACKEVETQLHKLWIYILCMWMFFS
jgi:hypothetical protein